MRQRRGAPGVSGPNEVRVKPALGGDLDEVARVWHRSALQMDGAAAAVPSERALRTRIAAELAAGWELHIATRSGRIVGMLALKPQASVLDQIFVLPEDQGRGVGKALMCVAKQVMEGGFTLRMASSNLRARRFYESQGLRALGEGTHPATGVPVTYFGWNRT